MDIAPLTFRVDSSGAVTAEGDLDELTAAAGRADAAQESLAASAGRAAAAETNMSAKAKAATAAVNAHTVAAKANTAAMNMQAASARAVAGRQQQMMFQTNDIAMSLASGQAPYMVAIQQGSQLAQVYAGPGGLNNALRDFNKLMVGVVGTLVRFAAPIAAATAAAGGLYLVYRQVTADARNMRAAMEDLDEVMDDARDAMADAAEYSHRIDLARMGMEADSSVGPVDRLSNALTGVAASLNDVTVARWVEETARLGIEADRIAEKIAQLEKPVVYGFGSMGFEMPKTREQERLLLQLRQQEAGMRAQQRDRLDFLSPERAQSILGALGRFDLNGMGEQFRDALDGAVEPAEKTGRAIDEAARSMERLTNEAEKYADGRAKAQLNEVEYINYRRDRDVEAIQEAADAAIAAGNNVHEVEALANAAAKDRRLQAEHDIADLRERLVEQSLSRLQSGFDAWMREIEDEQRRLDRERRDRERLSSDRVNFERSLQPGTDMQQVDWWEADALARNDELWREGVRLYGEAQAERLGLKQQFLDRETEIERIAAEDRKRIRQAQYSATLGASANFFGAMGQLLDSNTEKQSAAAQAAFAIAKGLDLAQATMNSYVAITEAWADPTLPYFMKIAASIQAATTVMAAVANIRRTTLSGAREMGGPVYGGGTYLVGEKGPELFTPGASGQITSNANLQKAVKGGGEAPNIQIINNAPGVVVRKEGPDMNPRFIIEQAKAETVANLRDDIANGGDTSRLIEGQYGLNRGSGSR
ncbi:phage tail length tape measure family protein [Thalassovita mediterranea]|nr:phage tail length tape measure family protein [Thalassovita mediterranea]